MRAFHSTRYVCASCARNMRASTLAPTLSAASALPSSGSVQAHALSTSVSGTRPLRKPSRLTSQIAGRRLFSSTQQAQAPSSSTAPTPSESAEPDPPTTSPPTKLPYYSLFPQTLPHGPPPSAPFAIDVRALRREFLTLQAASHPDFHHHASSSTSSEPAHSASRARAEATSAHINAAYRTLADPLTRGQYLLREQYGIDLAGDESTGAGNVEQDVLLAVMEAREEIESAQSEQELEGLREMNAQRLERTVQRLGEALERADVDGAKKEGVRLRYWRNVKESIDAWEEGKGGKLQH